MLLSGAGGAEARRGSGMGKGVGPQQPGHRGALTTKMRPYVGLTFDFREVFSAAKRGTGKGQARMESGKWRRRVGGERSEVRRRRSEPNQGFPARRSGDRAFEGVRGARTVHAAGTSYSGDSSGTDDPGKPARVDRPIRPLRTGLEYGLAGAFWPRKQAAMQGGRRLLVAGC